MYVTTETGESIIEVRNLSKSYDDVVAVDDLSFSVRPGEIFGLLGPNGAGKTTTLACIEGIMKPDDGTILVNGYDPVTAPSDVKRSLGVQLQSTSLLVELNVEEQIKLFMQLYGQTATIEKIEALLEQFALTEKRKARPDKLSGGQKQRLALALAMVSDDAVIIILDEPTAGLDPQARRNVWNMIRRLRQDGKTVIVTTHYMEEAEKLCDRVGIVDHGKLLMIDTPKQLIDHLQGRARVTITAELNIEEVQQQAGVYHAWLDEDEIHIQSDDVPATIAALHALASEKNTSLAGLNVHEPNLEEVFLNLTGRRIRA